MTDVVEKGLKRIGITVSRPVLAVICIIFGIILIIFPDLVGILVGIFLLIQGILLLTDYMEIRHQQPTRTHTTTNHKPITNPSIPRPQTTKNTFTPQPFNNLALKNSNRKEGILNCQ